MIYVVETTQKIEADSFVAAERHVRKRLSTPCPKCQQVTTETHQVGRVKYRTRQDDS